MTETKPVQSVTLRDRLLLWLCLVSLLAYLACSLSVRAFLSEFARLAAKL